MIHSQPDLRTPSPAPSRQSAKNTSLRLGGLARGSQIPTNTTTFARCSVRTIKRNRANGIRPRLPIEPRSLMLDFVSLRLGVLARHFDQMEAAGIEPASRGTSASASTCVACLYSASFSPRSSRPAPTSRILPRLSSRVFNRGRPRSDPPCGGPQATAILIWRPSRDLSG